MDVRLPDGTLIKDVPEGTTKAQLTQKLRANGMAVPADWLGDAPAAPTEPTLAQKITGDMRRVGLTARYGLEGLASIGDIVHEPIRAVTNAVGLPRADSSLTQLATRAADAIGLPSPRDSNERVVGDASRMVAGSAGMAAGTAAAAGRAAPGVLRDVLVKLSANAGSQAAGAAGAGLAGGSVREQGGSPLAQFGASLAGGLAGGLGANALSSFAGASAKKLRQMMTPASIEMAAADQKITMVLERAGIDWSEVPERIRQGMRQEVAAALNTGAPLNEKALQRLLVFKRADVTPTVGQLTQDPGMITREANLAKTGANSTNPSLQALPALQNRNVLSLLSQLDEAGASGAPSQYGAGMAAINSLDALATRAKGNINQLYQGARDTSGRSLPLEGGTFTRNANIALDEANVGSFLPTDIANKMNAIASGKYPLTIDVAEQLKTSIGNIQRGSADGNVRDRKSVV